VPAAPTTTLAPGSQGPQVRALQRALRALGFYTGPIDGGYGPKTQQAVSAFQRSVGLTADGVLGPATLKRLRAAG
jgi:N-acetylmuramoyl-L-alanine amidase